MALSTSKTSNHFTKHPDVDMYLEVEQSQSRPHLWIVWVYEDGLVTGRITSHGKFVPIDGARTLPYYPAGMTHESREDARETVREYKRTRPHLKIIGGLH